MYVPDINYFTKKERKSGLKFLSKNIEMSDRKFEGGTCEKDL